MGIEQIITENLKKEIESSGKSKTTIANEIGIVKSTLSKYLSGEAYPSLVTFAILCKVIDCSADEILNLKK